MKSSFKNKKRSAARLIALDEFAVWQQIPQQPFHLFHAAQGSTAGGNTDSRPRIINIEHKTISLAKFPPANRGLQHHARILNTHFTILASNHNATTQRNRYPSPNFSS